MLVITLSDILGLLCGLFLLSIFIFCKLSDWQKKKHDENNDDDLNG